MSGIINHCHKKIKNLTVKLQSTQKETILELASIIIIFYDVRAKFPIEALIWPKTWNLHCEDRIQSMGKISDWQLIIWPKNRRTAPHFKANNDGASLCFGAEAMWINSIPTDMGYPGLTSSGWSKNPETYPDHFSRTHRHIHRWTIRLYSHNKYRRHYTSSLHHLLSHIHQYLKTIHLSIVQSVARTDVPTMKYYNVPVSPGFARRGEI